MNRDNRLLKIILNLLFASSSQMPRSIGLKRRKDKGRKWILHNFADLCVFTQFFVCSKWGDLIRHGVVLATGNFEKK